MSSISLSQSLSFVDSQGLDPPKRVNTVDVDECSRSSMSSGQATLEALRSADLSPLERSVITGEPDSQSLNEASALQHRLAGLDEARMEQVLTPLRPLKELIQGHEDQFNELIESLISAYLATEQYPASGVFDRGSLSRLQAVPLPSEDASVDAHQRLGNAYKSLIDVLKLAGPNFDREYPALKAEILKRVMEGLSTEYQKHSMNSPQVAVNRSLLSVLPTAAQLEDMLFGVRGAADAARAPLFALSFDLNKASTQRKLDRRDHASADFASAPAAERALKSAFATSSAMFLQAQAQQVSGKPFLSSLDKLGVQRSRTLVNVLDEYVSSCELRASRGELVDVAVLAQIKALLDKSWNPSFGGVGRFSPSYESAKPSTDDFFTRFDLSTDLRGNQRAIAALRASINFYSQAMLDHEMQSSHDPLLADLRSVQVHSMVGQLINDLLLNPGLSKPPQSEELMRFYTGFNDKLLSKELDVSKIASLQRAMRSSPLFMELPLENITAPMAQSIAHCLGGGDKREAARSSLIQEALHLSPGSKRDLLVGLRGRFRDIDRGVALEITGRYQKPDGIMGLPDEGLDPQAGKLASELCDEAGIQTGENKRLLDVLSSSAYAAGERPVTVLRDRTLPIQVEALVNTERFDGLKGHDVGAKRARLLVGQLDKLADETKQSIDRLSADKRKLLADAGTLAGVQFPARRLNEVLHNHNDKERERLGPRIVELALSYDDISKSAEALSTKLKEIEALRALVLPASLAPIARGDALPRGFKPPFDDRGVPNAEAVKIALGELDFGAISALDQQGRVHQLEALSSRETVAGLIHQSRQRTYCSISGTTADLVLALYAQFGPAKLSPLLESIWLASESLETSTEDHWTGLSADAKALAAVVSVFMQRGGYHTPAEVLGGLLVAAGAMRESPDAGDAILMTNRYSTLLDRLSEDPAAFFIVQDDQAKSFRKHIGAKSDRLVDLSRGFQGDAVDAPQAPATRLKSQVTSLEVRTPSSVPPALSSASQAQHRSDIADRVIDDVGRYPQVLGFDAAREREAMRTEAAATLFALKAEELRQKLSLTTDALNLPLTIIDGLWDIQEPAMQLATGLDDDNFEKFVDSIEGLAEADIAISALTASLSIARFGISIKKASQVKDALIKSLNAAEVKLGQAKELGKLIEKLIEKRAALNAINPSDDAQARRKYEAIKDLSTTLERLQQAHARLEVITPSLRQKIQTLRYKLDEADLKKVRFAAGIAYKGLKTTTDIAKLAGGAAGTTIASATGAAASVFLPLALISFGVSTKRAYDNTRDAIRINKDVKLVDQQLLSLRAAVADSFRPPLSSDKAIDKALEARPSEREMMRMLLASRDHLKREHKLYASTAVAESIGAVSSSLSVASSTLSALGVAGAPVTLGVSLGLTAAGLLIGGLAAGINIGLWLYKRHAARQKQDNLHDAQTGLESLKAGGSLDYLASLNPFIAGARRAAAAELKRSSSKIDAAALQRMVQDRCESFIRARHVNQLASTVSSLMTRELNEMGRFVAQCALDPALRNRLTEVLSTDEQAFLKFVMSDRPYGQEGCIPAPNPSDKALQRKYLALVSKLMALSHQVDAASQDQSVKQVSGSVQAAERSNPLMQRFPICSVLALKGETSTAVDGALALADMYFAGGHRESSEALMIQMGLAPLAVEDRAAGDYFSPLPQGPLREAAATGLVNLGAQNSASSVVSLALRSDTKLAKRLLEPYGFADLAPSSIQTSETENEKLRNRLIDVAGSGSAPGQFLANLLGSEKSAGMLVSIDRSNTPLASRSRAGRSIVGEGEGRAFSDLVQAYLANRDGLAEQEQFFVSVDLEASKKDRRTLSIPIRPDLQPLAADGRVRTMDFIACNRSRDRLRPDYVTYEKLGDSWFVRTTEKLARIEMNPETIAAKIKDNTTPYEEKLLYLQVRKDLQENVCLVKYSKI